MSLHITSKTDWTPELLEEIWKEIEIIAHDELELSYELDNLYSNQLEIVSAEQMLDAYSAIGMPVNYAHWSFGKEFLKNEKSYSKGHQGLAYEMVLNTSPCINLLMEENLAFVQTMVMAHAGVGHNAVFKNNVYFKEWTQASSIIDYMVFAREYIRHCEERYGAIEVELVLDACHALAAHGIDKFKRKHQPKMSEEARLKKLMAEDDRRQRELDIILKRTTINADDEANLELDEEDYLEEDEENILYFIMKKSPNLARWKREIVRIVYKINTYFSPQGQCVTGDNLVSDGTGLIRLDELITADGYQPSNGINLLTEGNVLTPISHTYLKKQVKVMELTTFTGKKIIGTPEHPIMALNGLTNSVKKLADFKIGDHLALNLNYSPLSGTEYALRAPHFNELVECTICGLETNYLPTHITQGHKIPTTEYRGELSSDAHRLNKSANHVQKYPASLTPDMAEFLALVQNRMPTGLTSIFSFYGNEERLSSISTLIFKLFGIQVQYHQAKNNEYQFELSFSSWSLRKFMEENFKLDNTCYEIRRSPAEVVSAYLKMFIDIHGVRREVISTFEVISYNREELETLQVLFNALGIIVRITDGSRMTYASMCRLLNIEVAEDRQDIVNTFSLKLVSGFNQKFEELIGSTLDLPKFYGNARIASFDLIPGGVLLIEEIKNYVRSTKAAHFNAIRQCTWQERVKGKLLMRNQGLPNIYKLPYIRAAELSRADVQANPEAFTLACSVDCKAAKDLAILLEQAEVHFYDKVVSVRELEELHDVYDVTVPENHLFWMSGLISHNTKTLNEGMATFCHHYIMERLEEKGIISSDAFMAYLTMHAGVVYQPNYDSRHYSGPNPYALGFAILADVRRICENPTDEDREWFPNLIGKRWQDAVKEASFEHRDDSFIMQYLSPKVIRDLKLFTVHIEYGADEDDEYNNPLATAATVSEIHDAEGYRNIRTALAQSKERINYVPQISVVGADFEGDRTLYLQYESYQGRELDEDSANEVLSYLDDLWGYQVTLDA